MGLSKRGRWLWLSLFLVLVFSSLVIAAKDALGREIIITRDSDSEESMFSKVWGAIVYVGGLEFLGLEADSGLFAFLRLVIGLLVFTLFFEGARFLPVSNGARIVIAGVLGVLSTIMIPSQVLVAISVSYSTVVALVLIGVPVVGGLYAIWRIPSTNVGLILLKLVILAILLWILTQVENYAVDIAGGAF